ncbi:SusE domain-containing protein [Fulvivirga ulvae]|uniref:SusE domain-containing protein n=1 Tax=Fulvivirga ulvae TaxID=2904245 RepID=UPI001F33D412|nr:SusE domain-containing protein [Fulvivirga ulvae]UII30772.1 SusE domain-containing protein [Fulvivirga ulvae]
MKNIYLILIAVFVAFSCEQEEFEGSGLESLRDFELSPVSGARIELSSVAPDEEVVISWNEARSGFNSTVNYTWLVDEVGGDFSFPLLSLPSDNDGTATKISLTNEEFDQALAALGLNIGEEIEVQWTVSATNGDLTKVAEANTITVRRYVDAISPFDLLSPTDESTQNLDIAASLSEVKFEWDSAFSGLGNDVVYTWQAILPDGDFSSPDLEFNSNVDGKENYLALTHQLLEDTLAYFGVEEGKSTTIQWKVLAQSGDLLLESNQTFSLTIRRFVNITELYLVGGSTSAGWNEFAAVPFRLIPGSSTEFEIYEYITVAGDGFKFLPTLGTYTGDIGKKPGEEGIWIEEGEENVTVASDGFYRVVFDAANGTYSVTEIGWAIIGSGTPNDWNDPDTDMEHSGAKGDYKWTIDVTLVDGELKFRANDGWDINFGDDANDGSMEYGGANIPVSGGTYTITLDLDPVNGYSYSIN